jgi:phospholipid/cholesterol/gamma-HCH transport system substrate-binding protein
LKKLNISNETLVGALAAVAITVLILGFNFLKGEEVFSTTSNYYVRYPDAAGLQNSASVLHQGVKVGSVRKVTLAKDGQGVMVQFYINNKVKVLEGTVAKLISTDFFGTKALAIVVGNGQQVIAEDDTLTGLIEPSLLETLGTEIDPLRKKTESLLTHIDTLVAAIETDKVRTIMANLEKSSSSLNQLVSEQDSRLNKMLADAQAITSNLRKNNELINAALANVHAISDSLAKSQLTTTINNARLALEKTDLLLTKINKGEGSMGLLVNDTSLYYNLSQSAVNLDRLLIDLKENPKRYVHFSIFGKKK